jgi:hypothetical protein
MSTHLASHNDVACPHVLQASTALTRTPWNHTSVPWNYVSKPWKHVGVPFFILVSYGPQRTARDVVAPEPSSVGRRGLEP